MSRLWPDQLSLGLFPGHCWLRPARGQELAVPGVGAAIDADALLHGLETLLGEAGKTLPKHGRASLLVSDSVAAVASLPWQGDLSGAAELEAYGRVCFEQQGVEIDDGWIVHSEFRHFRAPGMAYALPRAWMEELVKLLAAHGLRLRQVLPVSAAAYTMQAEFHGARTALLLRERSRVSALVYEGRALSAIDVEPVTASADDAGNRLLRRLGADGGAIGTVFHWSPSASPDEAVPAFIEQCLPEVAVHGLARDVWSR